MNHRSRAQSLHRLIESLEPRQLLAGAQLVKDITAGQFGSDFGEFVDVNGTLFFVAGEGAGNSHGDELWKSDGTAAGTVMVKDILTSTGDGSNPDNLTNVNGTLFFVANDGAHGRELWKSDGTAAGTVMVKDIRAGSKSSAPALLTNVGGVLFFVAVDATHGQELWKSDGTSAGTVLVKDVVGGSAGSNIHSIAPLKGHTALFSQGLAAQSAMWKTDGTSIGTVRIRTFDAAPGNEPANLTNANGTVYFSTDDGAHGDELWKSNGSEAGTVLVKDIVPGIDNSSPSLLTAVNGILYFAVHDQNIGAVLWQSKGSAANTKLVPNPDANNGALNVNQLVNVSGFLYLTGLSDDQTGIFWIDSAGQVHSGGALNDPNTEIEPLGETLYVATDQVSVGTELFQTQGTDDSMSLVKDIDPGVESSTPLHLTASRGKLYFSADDGVHGRELWKYTPPKLKVKRITTLPDFYELGVINGVAFEFASDSSHGTELWKTNLSTGKSALVKDINPGHGNSFVGDETHTAAVVNGLLIFNAFDSKHGLETWRSDGTAQGTFILKDFTPGTADSTFSGFSAVAIGSLLYFTNTDPQHGRELWKTDGTSAGTVLVRDLVPGADSGNPFELTAMDGTLYFETADSNHISTLWKSTSKKTIQVLTFSDYPDTKAPRNLVVMNHKLYFSTSDENNILIWQSDGSAAGTFISVSIPTVDGGSLELTSANGRLYFSLFGNPTGDEPWISDGTQDGTHLLKDIDTNVFESSRPDGFTALGNRVYFSADDGIHGDELWSTDGVKTTLVADIKPGADRSSPFILRAVGTNLYFDADNGTGSELWVVNNTTRKPVLVQNIAPGSEESFPFFVDVSDQFITFSASDLYYGRQLWQLPI